MTFVAIKKLRNSDNENAVNSFIDAIRIRIVDSSLRAPHCDDTISAIFVEQRLRRWNGNVVDIVQLQTYIILDGT